MERNPQTPLTDAQLHAFVDGQLPPDDRARVEAQLVHDASARERLAAWQLQRDAIRALHRDVLDGPVPPSMQETALRADLSREQTGQWWRWGGMAAGLVLAFGVGWTSHALWPGTASSAISASAGTGADFAHDAALAHAVYSPEVRHPVEVAASEQEHLVQWLSRRTGKPLKVPNLSAQGFELVGGRLLPGDAGARAQFMFQGGNGVRVTLYVGAVTQPSPDAPDPRETAFRFSSSGPVSGFYWVDQGFGYALSGPLSRDALMALAKAVYPQL